jgi:hypothetical protein
MTGQLSWSTAQLPPEGAIAPGWRVVHVGVEGDDLRIGGLPVWTSEWRRVEAAPVGLPHPQHQHQVHTYWIFEIGDVSAPVRFASGELSNGVYGFYVPA